MCSADHDGQNSATVGSCGNDHWSKQELVDASSSSINSQVFRNNGLTAKGDPSPVPGMDFPGKFSHLNLDEVQSEIGRISHPVDPPSEDGSQSTVSSANLVGSVV